MIEEIDNRIPNTIYYLRRVKQKPGKFLWSLLAHQRHPDSQGPQVLLPQDLALAVPLPPPRLLLRIYRYLLYHPVVEVLLQNLISIAHCLSKFYKYERPPASTGSTAFFDFISCHRESFGNLNLKELVLVCGLGQARTYLTRVILLRISHGCVNKLRSCEIF